MTLISSKPVRTRHLWSPDTGQWIPCFDRCQLTITWMFNIKNICCKPRVHDLVLARVCHRVVHRCHRGQVHAIHAASHVEFHGFLFLFISKWICCSASGNLLLWLIDILHLGTKS